MPIMSRSVNIFVLGWKKNVQLSITRWIGQCNPKWVAD